MNIMYFFLRRMNEIQLPLSIPFKFHINIILLLEAEISKVFLVFLNRNILSVISLMVSNTRLDVGKFILI